MGPGSKNIMRRGGSLFTRCGAACACVLATTLLTCRAGHILSLEPHIAHDVEACEESAFLLTIA
jgi:hypothetical protein